MAAARGRAAAARVAAALTSCRLLSDRRPLLAKAFYKKVSNHSAAYPGSPGKAAPRRCAPNQATFSLSPPTRFCPNLRSPTCPTQPHMPEAPAMGIMAVLETSPGDFPHRKEVPVWTTWSPLYAINPSPTP